jgi:hypothetical protein
VGRPRLRPPQSFHDAAAADRCDHGPRLRLPADDERLHVLDDQHPDLRAPRPILCHTTNLRPSHSCSIHWFFLPLPVSACWLASSMQSPVAVE